MADRSPYNRRAPGSTYRLQLFADFGFREAKAIVPYLERLGVSHLYLSPILQAAPGSMHGYDVVDHTRVSEDLGSEAGLVELADAAHHRGIGVIVDIVPNHMAMPAPEHLNAPLWETLREGRSGRHAHWFDVDWDHCGGRIGLPVLGGPVKELLAAHELELATQAGDPVLRYGDHVFPLAPGSEGDNLEDVLEKQHYLLADWHDKAQVLNYRRFFDVDTLVAIRVELDDVFDETHALLLDLHSRGIIDGFRIDHPDGLADPEGYLERLRSRVGEDTWFVVEKILEPGESLPTSWSCAGTTGYDAIRALDGALAPPVAEDLDQRWQAVGGTPSYRDTELAAKRLVIKELFRPEIGRLASSATAATQASGDPLDREVAVEALSELLAHVEVYRAYVRPGIPPGDESADRIDAMCRRAVEARPDLTREIDTLRSLVSGSGLDGYGPSSSHARDFVVRFQQVCGPVMAKGVEDTTYYRWHRFIALNEVGGNPLSLDEAEPRHLHDWARLQALDYPLGMTTLSTHDTKRNEDVRSRLIAIAEDLDGWDAVTAAVRRQADECGVDPQTAYFVAQTLMGAWPLTEQRLDDYLLKAIREAKQHTSWNEPDEDYESRVGELARRCLVGPVTATLEGVLAANAAGIRATTLGSKLVQLTMPGVPDVYQGEELVSPSLVDPDNRRPVDYERRLSLLERLDAEGSSSIGDERSLDAEKLWITSRTLRLRRERPDLFGADAGYTPLDSESPHVLGFLRGAELVAVVTRWPGRLARTGWAETRVALPAGTWTDVLTGTTYAAAGGVNAADLLRQLPVALLLSGSSAEGGH
jgi:(1->4)-alpha-D-glucan 1-alpha-D-glucosylmutase